VAGADFDSMPERQGSAFYRERAKLLREMAEKALTGENQEVLLKIALDYERLADSVDARCRVQ
jgi:hypothetical protein